MGNRALFVGRFQPFHLGHLHMLKQILEDFDGVILGVGSSQFSHEAKNPFTSAERSEMIRRTLEEEGLEGCLIVLIPDVEVNSEWVSHVLSLVPPFQAVFSHDPLTRRLFKEAGINLLKKPLLERDVLSGTEIRRRMLESENWRELVPPRVADLIMEIDGVGRVKAVASVKDNEGQ